MTLADGVARPHEVTLDTARRMAPLDDRASRACPASTGTSRADFDTLVDSPIVAGNPPVHEFMVDGKRHYLVNEGETPEFDGGPRG